jgi:hypothetical protein
MTTTYLAIVEKEAVADYMVTPTSLGFSVSCRPIYDDCFSVRVDCDTEERARWMAVTRRKSGIRFECILGDASVADVDHQ